MSKTGLTRLEPAGAEPDSYFYDGFPLSAFLELEARGQEREQIVSEALEGYIDDDSVVAPEGADEFPSRAFLSGDYVVASRAFKLIDRRKHLLGLSEVVHLLDKSGRPYLGLEVHVAYDRDHAILRFDGDIDSFAV